MRNLGTNKLLDIFINEKLDFDSLARTARNFFKDYGTPKLLGRKAALIFKGHRLEDRFDVLLGACAEGHGPVSGPAVPSCDPAGPGFRGCGFPVYSLSRRTGTL